MSTLSGAAEVKLFHWNPKRPVAPGMLGRAIPIRKKINNFGDLLGPFVVERILRRAGIANRSATGEKRLLSVGSVMHFANDDDVIWGTGINGKEPLGNHQFSRLDVRAVRGPRTRNALLGLGIEAPAIYGDPGLLVPKLVPELGEYAKNPIRKLLIVPNFNDIKLMKSRKGVLDPRSPLMECLITIAQSESVIASSLHGIIIAESLGIPVVPIVSDRENPFKYHDYFEGTGRHNVEFSRSVNDAIESGKPAPGLLWDDSRLLEAFPWDLWQAKGHLMTGGNK